MVFHAEGIDDKSEIFQIWFDPDLSKSLQKKLPMTIMAQIILKLLS